MFDKNFLDFILVVEYFHSSLLELSLSQKKSRLFADLSIMSACMLFLSSVCFSSSVTYTNSLNWSFKVAPIEIT